MILVPWTQSIDFRMPVSVWHETIEHYYPKTGWVALRSETLERSSARSFAAAWRRSTPRSRRCLQERSDG